MSMGNMLAIVTKKLNDDAKTNLDKAILERESKEKQSKTRTNLSGEIAMDLL